MNAFWISIRTPLLRIGNFLLKFVGSTYLIIVMVAGSWMVFFDRYNLISQYKMRQQIAKLAQDKAFYEKATREIDYAEEQLHRDPEALERYAREKYFMKKSDEDVFVIR